MKTQRSLTVVIATLVLLVLSFSITLTATGSGHPAPPDQRKVVVTIRIVDDGGNTISGVHISVYQGEQYLGQGESDAKGIAQVLGIDNLAQTRIRFARGRTSTSVSSSIWDESKWYLLKIS